MDETIDTGDAVEARADDTLDARTGDALEASLCRRFEAAMRRAPQEAHLVWRGRTLTGPFAVEIGRTRYRIIVDAGRVTACAADAPLLAGTRFTIRGSRRAWSGLWEAVPQPGWHDLFALTKRGEMSIDGDTQAIMAHLQYLKDLLALPRQTEAA